MGKDVAAFVEIECDNLKDLILYKLNTGPVLGYGDDPKFNNERIQAKEIEGHFVIRSKHGGDVGIEHSREDAERRVYDLLKEEAEKYMKRENRVLRDSTKYADSKRGG